jgi:protein tyrosine phosphatase (PTP) superfamily phosphohydrolase (DUF442 family)
MAGTPATSRSLVEKILRGTIAGLLVGVSLHAGLILGGSNFHAVLPGEVYRCGQPTGPNLERFVREHGIRTVVNLRGCCPGADWYRAEAEAASALGVSLEDVNFSATRLPSPQSVGQLVELIDRADYPILFHCQQGADRTGLASALAVLLRTDATLEEGLRNLGLATGHLAVGRTRHVDRFFAFYAEYLAKTATTHSPDTLRAWIRDDYCPAEGRARMTLLTPLGEPREPRLHARAAIPQTVTIRCHNASTRPWHFRPGGNAGIHLYWRLLDHWQVMVGCDRTGLLRATIPPGGSIDLSVALPGVAPGRYELLLDLTDEQQGTFVALGNEPFLVEVLVP